MCSWIGLITVDGYSVPKTKLRKSAHFLGALRALKKKLFVIVDEQPSESFNGYREILPVGHHHHQHRRRRHQHRRRQHRGR